MDGCKFWIVGVLEILKVIVVGVDPSTNDHSPGVGLGTASYPLVPVMMAMLEKGKASDRKWEGMVEPRCFLRVDHSCAKGVDCFSWVSLLSLFPFVWTVVITWVSDSSRLISSDKVITWVFFT